MNSRILADLLLELNVLNTQDVDREMAHLAAGISEPRAAKWMNRVARYFVINIEQLLDPARLKPETRGGMHLQLHPEAPVATGPSKHYLDPSGKWVGRPPEHSGGLGTIPREEDPEGKWATQFHQPQVQQDIEQSFTAFQPKKAKAKTIFRGPPSKAQLAPWMQKYSVPEPPAPETQADKLKQSYTKQGLYHFDPIDTRRRELWVRLQAVANMFNHRAMSLKKADSPDRLEAAKARETEIYFRTLEKMPTADRDGFAEVMQDAERFTWGVENEPWKYTKDAEVIAEHGNLKLIKAIFPQVVKALSRREQNFADTHYGKAHGVNYPDWCTKDDPHCTSYAEDEPLYFVDKNSMPYVLVHFHSQQAKDVHDSEIGEKIAKEIAPLFVDEQRFPDQKFRAQERYGYGTGILALGHAVAALRRGRGRAAGGIQ